MLVQRTFVFRIEPSDAQHQRLVAWEGALRFVWNLAHEQRLLGLAHCKDDKRYPSWFDQKKELTLLRAELPWLDDLPAHAGQQTLAHLDDAWRDCFSEKKGQPHFKEKGKHAMSIEEPSPSCFRLDAKTGVLRFTKLGNLPIKLHRPLEGVVKTCTLVREGDAWSAHLCCEVELPDPKPDPKAQGPVALDRGVTVAFADSNGNLVPNPRLGAAMAPKLAKLQRNVSKKKKGSKNRVKAKQKLAKVSRKLHRQREHFAHTWSYRYAKNHSVVVIEDLKLKNMVRSARGTKQAPGVRVAQKAGLNRAMADIAMGRFGTLVTYKVVRFGHRVAEVDAAYSSQTCAVCGHVDAASRKGVSFCCTGCGHQDHADLNAAKVLLQRYLAAEEANNRRTGGGEVCGGDPAWGEPAKQKPSRPRARTKALKRKGPQSLGVHAEDGLQMVALRAA